MERIPSGTELARPFLPAKDFQLSKDFYEALGFEKLLDGDVAIFWWAHIEALDLPGRFKVQAPRAPAAQPWGLRIVYIVDPSGVLWQIAATTRWSNTGLTHAGGVGAGSERTDARGVTTLLGAAGLDPGSTPVFRGLKPARNDKKKAT